MSNIVLSIKQELEDQLPKLVLLKQKSPRIRMQSCHSFVARFFKETTETLGSFTNDSLSSVIGDRESKMEQDAIYAWKVASFFHLHWFFALWRKYENPVDPSLGLTFHVIDTYQYHDSDVVQKHFAEACKYFKKYFNGLQTITTNGQPKRNPRG